MLLHWWNMILTDLCVWFGLVWAWRGVYGLLVEQYTPFFVLYHFHILADGIVSRHCA